MIAIRVVITMVVFALLLLISQCIVSPKSSMTILQGGIDEKGY